MWSICMTEGCSATGPNPRCTAEECSVTGPDPHYSRSELRGHEPVTEGQVLNDPTHSRSLELSHSQKQKVEWWVLGLGRQSGELLLSGCRFHLGDGRKFWRQMVGKNAHFCEWILCP